MGGEKRVGFYFSPMEKIKTRKNSGSSVQQVIVFVMLKTGRVTVNSFRESEQAE